MKDNYITLADYASSIGISLEEAAAKLKTAEYKDFYKEIGGVALVSTSIPDYKEEEAATEEEASPAPPARETGNTGGESPEEAEKSGDASAAEIEKLRQEIEELRQSVREKDGIIKEKDKQITEFALRFADLAQQAQVIAGQAQVLQAADKPKALEAQTAAAHEEEQPKKKGFLKRLFG